ncbi:hypothetical protein DFH11DRAFT_1730196 [Phellopilus nigrolimitatus]|nr:hypothetical protein DFH11DRAFT_1730196 [Phellopilus nigrolimitatus]
MPALYGFPTLDTYAFMHTKALSSFNFRPFDFETEFDFDFSTKPRLELKPEDEERKLHEPRPTRPRVVYDALKHFEEVAPFWKDVNRVDNRFTSPVETESQIPTAKPRVAHPDALAPNDRGSLLTAERAVGAPIRTRSPAFFRPAPAAPLIPAPSAPTSSDLNVQGRNWARTPSHSSLPPPSSDNFSGSRPRPTTFSRPLPEPRPQSVSPDTYAANATHIWPSGSRPSCTPGPTFDHFAGTRANERSNSIQSTVPTIPSQHTDEGIPNEGTEESAVGADEDDALTYFSEDEFDFIEEALDSDDDTFYTASECSGYSADSELTWSDGEDGEVVLDAGNESSVHGQRICISTSQGSGNTSAPMPIPSVPTYATSSAVSLPSISSIDLSASTSTSLAVPLTPRSQQTLLHRTVGMPSVASESLAAEKAARQQARTEDERKRRKGD